MGTLNDRFQEYKRNPEDGLGPLLVEVRKYAQSHLRDEDVVEDFILDKVFPQLSTLQSEGSFFAWITKAVEWYRASHAKKTRRRQKKLASLTNDAVVDSSPEAIEPTVRPRNLADDSVHTSTYVAEDLRVSTI